MPYVASSDLVRRAYGGAVGRLGAEVPLFLDDDYYAVTCPRVNLTSLQPLEYRSIPTFAARFDRNTLTHSTMAAPELSMQLIRD